MKGNKWLRDVLALARISIDRNDRRASNEHIPKWVARIDAELERRNFPIAIRPGDILTPRKVGQVVGQTYAYFGWLLDCLRRENSALSDRFHRETEQSLEADYDADIEASMRTFIDSDLVRASLRYRVALYQIFGMATGRPFTEAAAFFDGFSGMIAKRAKDETIWDESYSTSAAYYALRRDWQFVETFKNVSDLHTYLQHKLGRNAAGDLDRTRSLAKRLKLRLAPRGRPSKNWVKVPP
jgi:hypothetical protein